MTFRLPVSPAQTDLYHSKSRFLLKKEVCPLKKVIILSLLIVLLGTIIVSVSAFSISDSCGDSLT